jgi:hypothetical protein
MVDFIRHQQCKRNRFERESRGRTCVGTSDGVSRVAEMTPDMVGVAVVVMSPGRIAFPMNLLPVNATLPPFITVTAEKPSRSAKVHPTNVLLFMFSESCEPELMSRVHTKTRPRLRA